MGRTYLMGHMSIYLDFFEEKISNSDQNYHILQGVSVKAKEVFKTRVQDESPLPLTF